MGEERTPEYNDSMNPREIGCGERHTQGVRKDVIVVQNPCIYGLRLIAVDARISGLLCWSRGLIEDCRAEGKEDEIEGSQRTLP